jgi:transposase-like protein
MSIEIELPRLTSADLASEFGNDEAALRRYRMLAALLREGRAPGEVARTFGVSRESLRRLRHAFSQGGLAALRSGKRGGGHFARETPLALTMRQEFNANPNLSSAALWRRVSARLRDSDQLVPRSTFYRLLTQLRDEETSAANERGALSILRDALNALPEDPPLALGRSEFAALLLPDVRDPLQRGRWLQRAMRAAIQQLRPAEAGPILDDPRWRHYLIIAGEYETGEKRATLQDALALSASTYSRAKRDALQRLVALIPSALGALPPPEPPAALFAPPPPPASKSFEYDTELELYMLRLRQTGLALIWGAAGAGKMALASALAHRLQARGQHVVWHNCRPPESDQNAGINLLMTLAAALALDGQPRLWEQLRIPEPSQLSQYFKILSEALVNRHWTVIIANSHWLTSDEALRALDVLMEARERQHLRLVLVNRPLPDWADADYWPPLPFANDIVARDMFVRRLSGEALPPPPINLIPIGELQDRVAELVANIPVETLDALSAAQIAEFLAALRPIEEIAGELRDAIRLGVRGVNADGRNGG